MQTEEKPDEQSYDFDARTIRQHHRPQGDKTFTIYYGNHPGSDRFGNARQKPLPSEFAQQNGYSIYMEPFSNGYNLDAQVAAHYKINEKVADGKTLNRSMGYNHHFDAMAHQHDVSCWYAADRRDRVLMECDPNGANCKYPDKRWEDLTQEERANPTDKVLEAQQAYEAIRYDTDLALMKAVRDWEPEGALGKLYRKEALLGFQFLIEGYHKDKDGVPYKDRLYKDYSKYMQENGIPNEYPPFRTDIALNWGQKIGGIAQAAGLNQTDFEEFATLPLSEREQSFFHADLESLQALGSPKWVPNPTVGTDAEDAMNHGKIILQKEHEGFTINMVLDLDNGRSFSKTMTDPNGKVIYQETRTPTSELTPDNYFTPSYQVNVKQDGPSYQDIVRFSADLDKGPDRRYWQDLPVSTQDQSYGQAKGKNRPADPDNPNPELDANAYRAIDNKKGFDDAQASLRAKYAELEKTPEGVRTIALVEADIQRQHQENNLNRSMDGRQMEAEWEKTQQKSIKPAELQQDAHVNRTTNPQGISPQMQAHLDLAAAWAKSPEGQALLASIPKLPVDTSNIIAATPSYPPDLQNKLDKIYDKISNSPYAIAFADSTLKEQDNMVAGIANHLQSKRMLTDRHLNELEILAPTKEDGALLLKTGVYGYDVVNAQQLAQKPEAQSMTELQHTQEQQLQQSQQASMSRGFSR